MPLPAKLVQRVVNLELLEMYELLLESWLGLKGVTLKVGHKKTSGFIPQETQGSSDRCFGFGSVFFGYGGCIVH